MRIKNSLIALLSAFAALSTPASAGVVGMADMWISRFAMVDGANVALPGSAVTIVSDARSGAADSQFNNVTGTGIGASYQEVGANGTVDVGYRCAGATCASLTGIYGTVENNLGAKVYTPAGDYALADMFVSGNALSTAPSFSRADTSVTSVGSQGSVNSAITNSVSVKTSFTVTSDVKAKFTVDFAAFVNAYVSTLSDQTGAGAGQISSTVIVTGTGGFNRLYWAPPELNTELKSSAFAGNGLYEASGTLFSEERTFLKDQIYTITINQGSMSSAVLRNVPEPGSVALFGLGLFALAGVGRRLRS